MHADDRRQRRPRPAHMPLANVPVASAPSPYTSWLSPAALARSAEGPQCSRGSLICPMPGKEYLDYHSGQVCSALGHSNPTAVEAIKDCAFSASTSPQADEVRQRQLLRRALEGDLDRQAEHDSSATTPLVA